MLETLINMSQQTFSFSLSSSRNVYQVLEINAQNIPFDVGWIEGQPRNGMFGKQAFKLLYQKTPNVLCLSGKTAEILSPFKKLVNFFLYRYPLLICLNMGLIMPTK